jgi:Fur family peroxide stress response transcriptional regulator
MRSGPETIAEREKAFATALAADGLRLTHQRLEIIREMAAADDHPDADEILRRVRVRIPTLSQDTVYRALAALVKRGLVEPVMTPRATRFDPDRSPHHHFVCDHCGRLEDVGADVVQAPKVPEVLPGIGEVRAVHTEMCGLCVECRK